MDNNFFQKLNNLDVRWLYLLMVIFVTFPLLKPLGLPLAITGPTQKSFDWIKANIKPGDVVLIDVAFDPSSAPELLPMYTALGKWFCTNKVKIVTFSTLAGGFMYQKDFTEELALKQFGYKYGEDIVMLPFKAGNEAAYSSFGRDMKGLYTTDWYGKPLTGMPLWDSLKTPKDFKVAIGFSAGDNPVWLLRQVSQQNSMPMMAGVVASSAAMMTPFWASGQFVGYLVGMSGAAELEVLSGFPGRAAGAMDGQSFGHLLIILFVILGNIGYYYTKKSNPRSR
jgi:hypothetical protein